jgi:hypothetical protein
MQRNIARAGSESMLAGRKGFLMPGPAVGEKNRPRGTDSVVAAPSSTHGL